MSAMTEDQTYNGWKNYPTWAVNLWLSNDEGLYNATRELVENAGGHRASAADYIRDFVREDLPIMVDNGQGGAEPVEALIGFHADLLGYALDQVDWFEIADAWLEQ